MPERATATSPESRAGSTPRSPTPRPPPTSTAACSAGSSRTSCRRTRPAATSSPGCRGGDVAAVGSPPEGAPPRRSGTRTSGSTSADETAAKVRAAGGTVLEEPFDVCDAGRMASSPTPRARRSASGRPGRTAAPAVVNEPGSLNFNDLNTRDLDGARAFYGAVFGWEVLRHRRRRRCGRCPRYGDFLEAAHTRDCARAWPRWARPTRFEDVVASVDPLADDQPDARRTGA